MIKKCAVVTLAVLLAFCAADARKRKPKSGKVVDNVYQDADHGFGLTFPKNWNSKTHKGDGIIRLTLVQKDFKPDSLFNRGWNEMTFEPLASHPLIELWILQTQLEPKNVFDSLLEPESKSKWRKHLFATIQPAYTDAVFTEITGGSYKRIKDGPLKGLSWRGTFEYIRVDWGFQIPMGVHLTCLRFGGKEMLVVVSRSEPEYLDGVVKVVESILESLKLPETDG